MKETSRVRPDTAAFVRDQQRERLRIAFQIRRRDSARCGVQQGMPNCSLGLCRPGRSIRYHAKERELTRDVVQIDSCLPPLRLLRRTEFQLDS
jgi:hypothetical protein